MNFERFSLIDCLITLIALTSASTAVVLLHAQENPLPPAIAAAKPAPTLNVRSSSSRTPTSSIAPTPTATPVLPTPQPGLKQFTANQFVGLYYQLSLPNINHPTIAPFITGEASADAHITALATARGYRLQPVAVGNLVSTDSQYLQPDAAVAWQSFKQAALTAGIQLGLVSGYRSVDTQRTLFLSRLNTEATNRIGRAYTANEIAAGTADAAIQAVLTTSSIPGYSRHHTGYALDIADATANQNFTLFKNTPAYQWLAANNFQHAKQYGFIPSYPEGAINQGPAPEAWEFIYVGTQHLLQ